MSDGEEERMSEIGSPDLSATPASHHADADADAEDAQALRTALALARVLLQRDKPQAALHALQEVGESAEVLCLRGIGLRAGKRLADANECLVRAHALAPDNPEVLVELGRVQWESGHIGEAVSLVEKALELPSPPPDTPTTLAQLLTALAAQCKGCGKVSEAISHLERAISVSDGDGAAHYALACVHTELLNYEDAEKHFRTTIAKQADHSLAHCNLGVILREKGDLDGAMKHYAQSLQLDPNLAVAHNNMAIALTDKAMVLYKTDPREARLTCERALQHNHTHAPAYYNLAVMSCEEGDKEQALWLYKLACHFSEEGGRRQGHGCAEAYNNMGVIYREKGNLDEAVRVYEKALEIRPDFAQTLVNLCALRTHQGMVEEAHGLCARAIQADPKYAEAYNALGVLYREEGEIQRALASYEACVAVDPNAVIAEQNRLFALNCVPAPDVDAIAREHCEWGRRFAKRVAALQAAGFPPPALAPPSDVRVLTVAYLSPDFFSHSVSYFVEAVIRNHDPERVRVVCYANMVHRDARTGHFRQWVEARGEGKGLWREVAGKTAHEVAQMVRDDGVHVLVELTGHTANNRLDVMALRPAPVQVTWIGYPNTTGLSQIDYRLTDAVVDPPSSAQPHAEKLWRLPRVFLCYSPSANASAVAPAPCLTNGFCTFGSFNALAKINDGVKRVWARVLRCLPNSRLLVKCKVLASPEVRRRFVESFEKHGIAADRIDLLGFVPHGQHYEAYGLMDLSLDTFPYAGTTTTCECLYQGVPCITFAKDGNHCHSVGATLCRAVGFPEWVCRSEQEYVRKAVEMGADFARLAAVREALREKMAASWLCDGPAMATDVERAFRAMCAERRECAENGEGGKEGEGGEGGEEGKGAGMGVGNGPDGEEGEALNAPLRNLALFKSAGQAQANEDQGPVVDAGNNSSNGGGGSNKLKREMANGAGGLGASPPLRKKQAKSRVGGGPLDDADERDRDHSPDGTS